jgi:hypothetical protein
MVGRVPNSRRYLPLHVDADQALNPTGRTAGAVYFEIRRLKMLAEGGSIPVKKRPRDSQPPLSGLTPVKTEPRPLRAARPSAAKRRYDEVADSGFWDESDCERPERPAKRPKGKVKFENDFQLDGDMSGSDGGIGAEE